MRWSAELLREYRERREKSAQAKRSDAGIGEGSLPGIEEPQKAEKAPPKKKPFRLAASEPSEAAVLDAIRTLLRSHPRVAWHMRINSGAMRVQGEDGRARFVRFHDMPGCSDLLGQMVDGRTLAIEVKRPSWRAPTDERERAQQEFIRRVCDAGGLGFFARSLEEALVYLGPMR